MRYLQDIVREIMVVANDDSNGYNTSFLNICRLMHEYGDQRFNEGVSKTINELTFHLPKIEERIKQVTDPV